MSQSSNQDQSRRFIPLYTVSSTGRERNLEPKQEAEHSNEELSQVLHDKLKKIEEREKSIAATLSQLEKSYALLAEREQSLNKKEETLNREYLKILELESLYKGMDKFSDSLNSVLPSLNTEELNLRDAQAKLKEDK